MKNVYLILGALILSTASMAQSPRTVLLETRETTQLMPSAEGICAKENVKAQFGSDVAIISFHDDNIFNGGDPLYNAVAAEWATFFAPANYPGGLIDRVSYNGTSLNLADDLWSDTIAARLNRPTDGLVTLPEVLYDSNTREIFVRIQVNFTEDVIENRDLRFFCYITRDNMAADQYVNPQNVPCGIFPTSQLDTIDTNVVGMDTNYVAIMPDYLHDNVAIASPSTFSGVENIIPNQVSVDMQKTTTLTYTLPNGVDLADLTVVGFVANFTPSDVTLNRVVNAAKERNFTFYDSSDPKDPNHPDNSNNPNSQFNPANWPTGINETPDFKKAQVYPNPVNDLAVVEFQLYERAQVKVTLLDITGKQVDVIYNQELAQGRQIAAFNGANYAPGMYFVMIESKHQTEKIPVIISR